MFDTAKIDDLRKEILKRQHTVATAESVTGGFLQAALASADDAIHFFQGGITAYNLGQKCRHLDIEPISAQGCNCVSAAIAGSMAMAACRLFMSHWGIGITGYASPVPESGNKVFAYFAIAHGGKVLVSRRIGSSKNKPMNIQADYVDQVISAFLTQVKKQKIAP